MHAFGLENGIKCPGELTVSIMNQEEIGYLALRELQHYLPGLLIEPTGIGIGGNTRQMHLARTKFFEGQDYWQLGK